MPLQMVISCPNETQKGSEVRAILVSIKFLLFDLQYFYLFRIKC